MGTSSLYAYEMKDSVWDGFGHSDAHLVPYTINEAGDLYGGQTGSCEKPWNGQNGVTSNESKFPNPTKKDAMLDKSPWSCMPNGAFHPSCKDDKEAISLPSNDTMMADQDFNGSIESANKFCSDGGILNEACTAVANNIYDYPMSQIPQTESQISFFENDNDGKEGTDLLCYGWPDIENFEEVDQMFRSCDSTFGQESLPNDDEMYWFPSSHDNKGSDDAMKSGFHVSSCDTKGQKGTSEGNKASRPEKFVDVRNISGNSSSLSYSSSSIEQHKHEGEPLSLACKQENIKHQHSIFGHHFADQISAFSSNTSGLSENGGNSSASAKESSYSSNQVLSVDTEQGLTFSPPMLMNQYKEKLYCQEDLPASLGRNDELMNSAKANSTYYKQSGNQKQPHEFDNEIEGHGTVEEIDTLTREIDSPDALDSSFTNAAPAATSLEAKSFHQLQQVMKKLDVRTKLCIRDGLYRLAKSAGKRHACDNLNGSISNDTEVNDTLAAEQKDRCSGFMDMETNTNPIDRSIAHLLFHGPSDPSIMAGGSDPYTFKFLPCKPA